MVQISSEPPELSMEVIHHRIKGPGLDFVSAKNAAKAEALKRSSSPILLSWKNGRTGKSYPDLECGKSGKPPWVHYALARGANLTVDINQGEFVFMFLKLKGV